MKRRLYKSSTDRILFGVCGGIADYLRIDPTIVRLVCVGLWVSSKVTMSLYFVLAILLPSDRKINRYQSKDYRTYRTQANSKRPIKDVTPDKKTEEEWSDF